MRCGTFPAQAAQASIKLPPTLEADKPALILQDPDQCSSTLLGIDFLSSYVLLGKKATSHAFDDMYESAIKGSHLYIAGIAYPFEKKLSFDY